MKKNDERPKLGSIVIDGCEYPMYYGGMLAKTTPKHVAETLDRLKALEKKS